MFVAPHLPQHRPVGHAGVQGLLERIERQVGAKRVRHPPAHDATGIGVDDERDVDEPHPGRDVRDAREPQGVWARGLELPVDPVRRARERRHARRRFHPRAPHHAAKTKLAHQPRDRAAGHHDALAAKLAPHLANPIHPVVLLPHPGDVLAQLRVAMGTRRQPAAVRFPGLALVVRRRGDRQLPANRLDPVLLTVHVDERRQVLGRRGRAPPERNTPTPCAGSRSPDEAANGGAKPDHGSGGMVPSRRSKTLPVCRPFPVAGRARGFTPWSCIARFVWRAGTG